MYFTFHYIWTFPAVCWVVWIGIISWCVSWLRSAMKHKDLGIWEDSVFAQIHPVWLLNLSLSGWKPFNSSEVTWLKQGFNKQKGGSAEKSHHFFILKTQDLVLMTEKDEHKKCFNISWHFHCLLCKKNILRSPEVKCNHVFWLFQEFPSSIYFSLRCQYICTLPFSPSCRWLVFCFHNSVVDLCKRSINAILLKYILTVGVD